MNEQPLIMGASAVSTAIGEMEAANLDQCVQATTACNVNLVLAGCKRSGSSHGNLHAQFPDILQRHGAAVRTPAFSLHPRP